MKVGKILVTGESIFIERHQFLFKAMAEHCDRLQFLPRSSEWYEAGIPRKVIKTFYAMRTFSWSKANALFQKNKQAFIVKSQRSEAQIKQLTDKPDLVFHVFSTYSPFWHEFDLPYVMYLDYTVSLAERNWPGWACFTHPKHRESWLECERLVYDRAKHIFTMSHIVKKSLIKDYDIPDKKITLVGSSGDFLETYQGKKPFGSKQILFNGSDFQRKGGDLVLAAFKKVKQAIPEAKLVIIGKKLSLNEDGIENPGHISSRADLYDLFLKTDLVVAPAYCDPFPTFLMEAMNYGIPCIVSNNDGMPEIVDDRVNGIVIEQLTADSLADRIIHLLNNPSALAAMSQAARDKVKTELNWKNIANKIVRVLSGEVLVNGSANKIEII